MSMRSLLIDDELRRTPRTPMPAINEIWQQALRIDAGVATLHADVAAATGRIDASNEWLEELRNLVSTGLATIAEGLAAIQTRQDATLRLMLHQSQQQDTIISLLEKLSNDTSARPEADRGE